MILVDPVGALAALGLERLNRVTGVFMVPAIAPRTVCFCQPIFYIISARVAFSLPLQHRQDLSGYAALASADGLRARQAGLLTPGDLSWALGKLSRAERCRLARQRRYSWAVKQRNSAEFVEHNRLLNWMKGAGVQTAYQAQPHTPRQWALRRMIATLATGTIRPGAADCGSAGRSADCPTAGRSSA
jgi:hypothetical protein